MNVLSLFDGMSCGQLALQRANIKYDNYYASEIDKYAISVTQYNFPDTIQLGDINNWKTWNLPKIDLILAGSPCQGFSRAGHLLNFDDPRSKLFFVFVDVLRSMQIKWLLFENVKMKLEWQNVISQYLHLSPVMINSALVSAQNRIRLYWTNVSIQMPQDKGILLKDIIESGEVDRKKSYCIDANYFKGGSLKMYLEKSRRQLIKHQSENRLMVRIGTDTNIKGHDICKRIYLPEGKSPSLTTCGGGQREPKVALDDISYRKLTPLECERLQTVPEGYTQYGIGEKKISDTQRYKMLGNGWTVDIIAHILKNIS